MPAAAADTAALVPLPAAVYERLIAISARLARTEGEESLLAYIIEEAAAVLDCEAASLLLYEAESHRLRFAAATGSDPEALAKIPVPLQGSIAGAIFCDGEPVVQQEVAESANHFKEVGEQVGFETRSLMGVPMRVGGETVGVLEALNKRNGQFSETDLRALTVIADHAAVALRNQQQLAALQQAYDAVDSADRLKTEFLTLASHELRTPLASIHGFASLLREEAEASGEADRYEFSGVVIQAAEQMRAVLDAMNEMTTLRGGVVQLEALPTPVPVQDVLAQTCRSVAERGRLAGLALGGRMVRRPLYVRTDPRKLRAAFEHVLDNALRFTPRGGRITVNAHERDGGAYIEVVDTGCGIPPEHLEEVFTEFHQLGDLDTREHEGLGLGLTLARAAIELHGGRIWAESEGLGQGATVCMWLPLAPAPEAGDGQAGDGVPAAATPAPASR